MATTPSLTVRGQFGDYGGRYVPETVIPALEELEEAYASITNDAEFQSELNDLLDHYVGRPTPIYHAARLSAEISAARRFTLNAKTWRIPALTKSITLSVKRCLPSALDATASSPRPAPDSTASLRLPRAPCSASSASSTWARLTCIAKRSTSSA